MATDGILDIEYDLDAVRHSWDQEPLSARPTGSHWRYRELLPLDPTAIRHDWAVGWTPLICAERLAADLGLKSLVFKDDGRNPSASFKDRASSVGVVHARSHGAEVVACASTGNAATSLAGHAAVAGVPCVIFVPDSAPRPKLAQLLTYSATVLSVQGTYDDAWQLCQDACAEFGWYNRNCAVNPVLMEGKATGGLEIADQTQILFGDVPDWVVVSVGDGCSVAGVCKGLLHMRALGVIRRIPRVLGVQAAGIEPIRYAYEHGMLPSATDGSTVADSINVPVPRNWKKAIRYMRDCNGCFISVSDNQILAAMRLAGQHGIFAEPAAAAALAGLVWAVNDEVVSRNESALVLITGSGLKDTESALRAAGSHRLHQIEPDLENVRRAIHNTQPAHS